MLGIGPVKLQQYSVMMINNLSCNHLSHPGTHYQSFTTISTLVTSSENGHSNLCIFTSAMACCVSNAQKLAAGWYPSRRLMGHGVVSEHAYWCSYRVCDMREQKDARPRVDALTAPTSNKDVLEMMKLGEKKAGKDYVLVDLRRNDYEVILHAHIHVLTSNEVYNDVGRDYLRLDRSSRAELIPDHAYSKIYSQMDRALNPFNSQLWVVLERPARPRDLALLSAEMTLDLVC
jgi:hypothetical protein